MKFFTSKKFIPETSVSLTDEVISEVFNTEQFDCASIQFIWTGTIVGSFAVETSSDGTNWDSIDLDIDQPNNSPSSHTCRILKLDAPLIRATYNNTSGSGTIKANLTTKGS